MKPAFVEKEKGVNVLVSIEETPVVIIEPSQRWVSLKLRELWEYRELLYFLAWRDIKVRYKQSVLGVGWALIKPFTTMLVFTFVFGKLANVDTHGIPYPVFSFAALVPWTLFSSSLTGSSNSLVGNANLLKKIYFPRLALPLSSTLSSFADFILAFIVLLVMMLFVGITPTANIIWLPVFTVLAVVTALGAGFWLSAMNVQFRDVRHAAPFMIQMLTWLTPIGYSSEVISEKWRLIYSLNPMAGVVEGFRWALLGTTSAPGMTLVASAFISFALFVSGAFFFRRMEKTFADVV